MTTNILQAALNYAEKYGFSVFPTHGVLPDGSCTCGNPECGLMTGKHPWTRNGLLDASNEPDAITAMFRNKPNANIGIVTGPVSNFFVVDVDGPAGEASLMNLPEMPETLVSTTGRGKHIYFRYPKDRKVYSRSGQFALGLDVRGAGGYVIAPPSQHYSGAVYDFLDENAEIADAPEWVLERACKPPNERDNSVIPKEERAGANLEWSVDDVRGMLVHISPDCSYSEWIEIGMALHDGGYGLAIWDEWSRRSGSKYKPGETVRKWKSFKPNGGVSFGTLVFAAKRNGWKPIVHEPMTLDDHPAREFLLRFQRGEIKVKDDKDEPPANGLLDPLKLPGLIGDTVRDIVGSAQKPQPMFALMNVLSALGAIYGRRYKSPMNTRTNLYTIALGSTASGKNHSREYIKTLMLEADYEQFLGPDKIVSGAGILTSVKAKPAQIMHIDEFGMVLESMMDKRATHMRVVSQVFTELYSSSGGIYLGGQYADEKSQSTRIPHPCLSIYGTATPDTYANNLNKEAVQSGELNRFIVCRTKVDIPQRQRFVGQCRPSEQVLTGWVNLYPGFKVNDSRIIPETITVTWPEMDDRLWEMGLLEDKKFIASRTVGPLWGRYRENCIKIAMIFAITRNPLVPIMNNDDMDIAEAIVSEAIEFTESLVATHLYESDHEKNINDIMRIVQMNGGSISWTEFVKRCKKWPSKQRDILINDLIEQGLIIVDLVPPQSGQGRPSKIIKLV
jgi:hypothetical protein